MTIKTTEYRVYHTSEAGSPESHAPDSYYYEPTDWDGGDVWSGPYPTRAAAAAAAEAEGEILDREAAEADADIMAAEAADDHDGPNAELVY